MAKVNKFTQSVLERLAQEDNKKQPTEKPVAKKPVKEVTPKKESIVNPVIEKEAAKSLNIPNIKDFISVKPERIAKNKTFYLDSDVIETLKKVAKQQGTTDSKLCNDILRKVLGLDS